VREYQFFEAIIENSYFSTTVKKHDIYASLSSRKVCYFDSEKVSLDAKT
jgi:hypothetical protein